MGGTSRRDLVVAMKEHLDKELTLFIFFSVSAS